MESISTTDLQSPAPTVAARAISLDRLDTYPPFLSERSTDDGLLLNNPLADLTSLRSLDRFTPQHRSALVDGIMEDLVRWEAPEASRDAARMLKEPNAYAVVTGQQAGIAGGPLYTLYKAIGTVRAAEELARLHPELRFVPVFWIEADDHDFEEVRRVTVLNRSGEPVHLSYDDGESRPLHIGDRMNSAEGIARLEAELREALPPTEFTDEALNLLTESYKVGDRMETLADGFARTLYAILGSTPLVILSSRNPSLKRLAADIFELELAEPDLLFTAVSERTAALAGRGMPTPITPKLGALFITHEGERRSLEPQEDGSYLIKGSDVRMSREEVLTLAMNEPERYSPKVSLRPLVQDGILPTALYLGGPSEIAYQNQLRTAYEPFGFDPPAVAERPFVLLLEPKARRAEETSGIELERLIRKGFDAGELLVDKEIERELDAARERALDAVRKGYDELLEVTKRIDPTLEKSLGAGAANASKGIEDLTKRLASALKKKQGTEIDRLNAAHAMVLPGGEPQERVLNPLYFVGKYSLARLRATLDAVAIAPATLQVIDAN